MSQLTSNPMPVTFVNRFTRCRLAEAMLPALPAAGDDVYVRQLGYEVVNCEWLLSAEGKIEILVVVRPQVNASGERPFGYEGEVAS